LGKSNHDTPGRKQAGRERNIAPDIGRRDGCRSRRCGRGLAQRNGPAEKGTPPSVVTSLPRDFGPNAPPNVYVFDPDIVIVDPLFTQYVQGNTPIKRLWTGALWSEGPAWSAQGRYLGVTVWTPEGKLIGRIRLPENTANLCFGGPKRDRRFMAASQSLYAVYVRTQGAAPG
jgi:SMP-30/Gluconolactonase/LRE-like region